MISILQKSFFTLLLIPALCFGQSNYYVSTNGNNAANGSLSTPWKTIQYGIGKLGVNDTLNVLTGTYPEKINLTKSSVFLRNYAGSKPVLDATGITSQNPIVNISGKSNVTVTGFEFKNNIQKDAQGILIDGGGANITIKNCIVHDIHFSSNVNAPVSATTNAQGIIVYGSNAATAITNLKITSNELYNCRLGYSEGLAVNGNVDGFLVADNMVHDITNIGIDIIGHEGTSSNAANDQARNGTIRNNIVHHCVSPYATSGGLYVDGGKNLVFENNISYHNGYGIEVGCENKGKTTDGIIVRNNIFYDNEICAIALGGFEYPGGSGKVINSSILNNTCYFNDYSNSGNGEMYLTYSEGTKIENNIFFTNTKNKLAYAELTQPQLSFNFNTFYCTAGTNSLSADWNGKTYSTYATFVSGTASNANSQFANPAFVAASITSPDFHLSSTSPCINKGNPAYVVSSGETDFYNQPRVSGVRIDMGAVEYAIVTASGDAEINALQAIVYPNPASAAVNYQVTEGAHQIRLYNAYGQIVFDEIRTEATSVSLHGFTTGIYVFEILKDSERVVQRLIVK